MINVKSIETNVTLACMNRCVGCNHFSPIAQAETIDPADLEHDLKAIQPFLRSAFYRLVGGEPTLHPDIIGLCKIVRKYKIGEWFQVWSNGQNLRRLPPEFWDGFDELIFSQYPGKVEQADIAWMGAVCASHGVKFTILDKHLFRLPFHQSVACREVTLKRYRGTVDAQCHQTMALDHGYFFLCSSGPFIPKYVLGLPFGTDGIAVDGLTEEKLRDYLLNPEPLQGCYRCDGYQGARIPWHETKRSLWYEESQYHD